MAYEIKYRSDNEMKDSGIEWLGKIPKEWEIIPNKYIAKIYTGNKDTQDSIEDGKYPFFVRSKNIERINSYSFDGEAILTPGDGDIGGIFHYINGKFDYHQRVYKYSDFSNYTGKYLYYYLKSYLKRKIMGLSAKSTVDSIRLPMLLNFECLLNDIDEQQKIANFLDIKTSEFDSIISKKEQLIEKLEAAKKSLISEVVTGKVTIVDGKLVDRKPGEMKDSGVEWLGMIPKDWEIKRIKHLVEINPSKSEIRKDNTECSFVPMDKIGNGNLEPDEIKKVREVYDGYTYFSNNDIVMAKVTPCFENGNIAIAKSLKNNIAFGTTEINVFRPHNIDLEFLYYSLQESHFMRYAVSHMTGVAGLKRVPTSYLENYKIAVPDMYEQNLISDYITKLFNNINEIKVKTQQQIKKLKEAKQSLISEAVTGKIDLRDWEIIETGGR